MSLLFFSVLVQILSGATASASITSHRELDTSIRRAELCKGRTEADCEVSLFRVIVDRKTVTVPGSIDPTFETEARFIVDFDSATAIKKYGVVEWFVGCAFSEYVGPNGHAQRLAEQDHMYFGQFNRFIAHDYQVNTETLSPLTTSTKNEKTGQIEPFALWRWNTDRESFEAKGSHFLSDAPVPHQTGRGVRVFTVDNQGQAFVTHDEQGKFQSAQGATLNFYTCLFDIRDLPKTTTPNGKGIAFNKALACVQWRNHNAYNAETQTIQQPRAFDPVCKVNMKR